MANDNNDNLWRVKLAARIHDPAEKALVLLRDPAGHEGGTVQAIKRLISKDITEDISEDTSNERAKKVWRSGLSASDYQHIKRADWWASAADRPQFPRTSSDGYASWAQVRWANEPILKHPLCENELELGKHGNLGINDIKSIKERSLHQFLRLAHGTTDSEGKELPVYDNKLTALALWRFGPELGEEDTADNDKLGKLWGLLPADTRIPDHSIWDHLDLVSAFSGAFASDPNAEVSLLSVSIGPVQPFIQAARSTTDLWAGSHLLSRMAWECIRPVAEKLGPDAVLFPRLRGVPLVDVWLQENMGMRSELFEQCDWRNSHTDANPLFAAALPNKFVALVPSADARDLVTQIEQQVRQWIQTTGDKAVDALLEAAGIQQDNTLPCYQQMREQLQEMPELHWSIVPWSLVDLDDSKSQTGLNTVDLASAMAPYYTDNTGADKVEPGFLGSPAWQVLKDSIVWKDGTTFFNPNPGVLYPAIYELAERSLAAAKSLRPFTPLKQEGWRCSLTGETEWLTTNLTQLSKSYRQQNDTLWARIAERRPAWARHGEHLGGISALKRVWPTLFMQEVSEALKTSETDDTKLRRFVVSTHTLALAKPLESWLTRGSPIGNKKQWEAMVATVKPDRIALPRKLITSAYKSGPAQSAAVRIRHMQEIAGLLEKAKELDDSEDQTKLKLARDCKEAVEKTLFESSENENPVLETYYAAILFDGDHMGEWLSGSDRYSSTYQQSFHEKLHPELNKQAKSNPLLKQYLESNRALSPNRHLAISGALNDYSLLVAPHIIETLHNGRLLYAGGDDVLALMPVADALHSSALLRAAYSGSYEKLEGLKPEASDSAWLHNGFALVKNKLCRMMGHNATASCGIVIAHHQAPLGSVMAELRRTEQRAKNEGGRNAFSISLIKRSGGSQTLTGKWHPVFPLLIRVIAFFHDQDVSRRASYNTQRWLSDIPMNDALMLTALLEMQFNRQVVKASSRKALDIQGLASAIAVMAVNPNIAGDSHRQRADWLDNFLGVAEFLARDARSGSRL